MKNKTVFAFLFLALNSFMLIEALPKSFAPIDVHHSFRPPFTVPFWEILGDTSFRDGFVRLTPDRQSRTGALWNTSPNRMGSWEVDVEFKIHGKGKIGADGLGFWLTERVGTSGKFYGNEELFKGLGVILDTFDNDRTGLHPMVLVLSSDGTHKYTHEHKHDSPHAEDPQGIELGNCHFPCRNFNHSSWLRIRYERSSGTLDIKLQNDGSGLQGGFRDCFQKTNVRLGEDYYFGFTAATGDLADNHDIISFTVKNLDSATAEQYNAEQYNFAWLLSRLEYKILHPILNTVGNLQNPTLSVEDGRANPSNEILQRINSQIEQQISTHTTTKNNLEETLQRISDQVKQLNQFIHDGGKKDSGVSGQTDVFDQKLDSTAKQVGSIVLKLSEVQNALSHLKDDVVRETVRQIDGKLGNQGQSDNTLLYIIIGLIIAVIVLQFWTNHKTRKEMNKKFF